MVRKSSSSPRTANVGLSLKCNELFQHLFRGIGGPVAEDVAAACSEALVPYSRELEPGAYSCPHTFRADYLAATILSKYDDGKSSKAKSDAAFEKFALAETLCLETNVRLSGVLRDTLHKGITAEAVLYTAYRKIAALLGPLDLNEAARGFDFGPGASTRLRRTQSDAWYKFQGDPETTSNNLVFARSVFHFSPLWLREVGLTSEVPELPVKVVTGNKVITVPKNARVDRIIAIEPDLNLYVQKGFGRLIRSALKKVGIDLNDQTQNQILARVGSCDDSLATIDLSMASDTVSRGIVERLLPPDWLSALEQCRSQKGVLPSGKVVLYRKFSSMGNGFTFELESLIFWALCSALADLMGETDRRISVYGDDIIIPVTLVDPFLKLLEICGFKPNPEKSFWSGPFRESCGKHYFRGVDVTPFYVRKEPRRLTDAFLLHNNVVRWSVNGSFRDSGRSSGLFDFCQAIRAVCPSNWRRPRIPLGAGDGAFVGSFDECTPSRAPRGFHGWRAQVLSEPRVPSNRGGPGRLLKSLHRLESRTSPLHGVVLQGFERNLLANRLYGQRLSPVGDSGRPSYAFVPTTVGYTVRMVVRGSPDARDLASVPGVEWSTDAMVSRPELKIEKFLAEVPMDKRARVTKILVPQWAELGPWI